MFIKKGKCLFLCPSYPNDTPSETICKQDKINFSNIKFIYLQAI